MLDCRANWRGCLIVGRIGGDLGCLIVGRIGGEYLQGQEKDLAGGSKKLVPKITLIRFYVII